VKSNRITALTATMGVVAALSLSACTEDSTSDEGLTVSRDLSGVLEPDEAAGEPVVIGFLDPSRGATGQPGPLAGANAAVAYINKYHGGIKGRPIQLETCVVDATPESIVSCANSFVEKEVIAVTSSATFNDGAALPILDEAGIPLIGNSPASYEAAFSPTAHFFVPAVPAFTVAPFEHLKAGGVTSVAYIFGDIPNNRDYVAQQFDPISAKLDVDFQPVYYDLNNVNWTSLAASLIATKADVVGWPQLPEDQCTDLIRALQDQGYEGAILTGNCTRFARDIDLNDSIDAYALSGLWLEETYEAAPAPTQDQLDIFAASLKDAGEEVNDQFSAGAFSTLVTLVDILTEADAELSADGVQAAVSAAVDVPLFLGPETISCDSSAWPGQSACATGVLMLKAQEDGSFAPAADPPFIDVDPSVLN